MPGIMIKAFKEMLSPTTKMDTDASDVSTDDRDNNNCSQRDHTEEACTSPVDQQNVSMFNHVHGSNQSTVNENTACGVLIKEQNIREQHVHNAGPSDGITISTDKGVKPKIRISVPAENGKTIVQVECANNKMTHCCYEQDDGQGWSLGSTWIFKNVEHGLIESIMRDSDDFTDFIAKLKELFRCKFKKMHNKSCLVLEFLHDTQEDRDRMMQDQEKVKTMFKNFLQGIGKDAPSCSLQVFTEPATDNISDKREMAEDKEDAAALPSQSLSEDAAKRKLPPRSSDEKSELNKRKLTQGSSEEKSQHYKSGATDEMAADTEHAVSLPSTSAAEIAKESIGVNPEGIPIASNLMLYPRSPDGGRYRTKNEPTESTSFTKSTSYYTPPFSDQSTSYYTPPFSDQSPFDPPPLFPYASRTLPEQRHSFPDSEWNPGKGRHTSSGFHCGGTGSSDSDFVEPDCGGTGSSDSGILLSEETELLRVELQKQELQKQETQIIQMQLIRLQKQETQIIQLQKQECTYCDGDCSEQRKGLFISLKSLARSALRLHPLPASAVKFHDCTTCFWVCSDANYHLGTEDNVFFIHLHQTQVDRKTQGMKPSAEYQFKKALSSMRNSGGGALFVHHCKSISRPDMDVFQSTVVPVLGTMLNDDEIMSDGFRWHRLEREGGRVYKIDVLPSETFITADMKTKLLAWCVNRQVCASFDKLKQLLLSSRKVPLTEPTIQGLPHMSQPNAVKAYVGRTDDTLFYFSYFSVSAWVDNILTASLPEYVTSISKRKQGGSVYVGRTSNDNKVDMDGIPFPKRGRKHEMQSMLAEELQKKICVFKNKYSDIALKPKDVFQIEIHDTGTNSGIIEVAVRPVDGCVFTDALGPASFRIENKSMGENHYKAFVRLPFDEWVEVASG